MAGNPPIILGYSTALKAWRTLRTDPSALPEGTVMGTGALSPQERISRLRALLRLDGTLDTCAPNRQERLRYVGLRAHVWTGQVDSEQLIPLGASCYLVKPELAFVQAAAQLDPTHLALAAYELAGTYCLASEHEGESITGQTALCTIAELQECTLMCHQKRIRYALSALHTLKLVKDCSNSPAESIIALLLMTSRKKGGFGLRGFKLNESIGLDRNATDILGFDRMRPDILWPEERVAIEYDSNAHHLTPASIARDSARRGALTAMGYTVFTLTADQLYSLNNLIPFMKGVARALRVQRRPLNNFARQHELHSQLCFGIRDPLEGS